MKEFMECMKKYAVFNGRSTRREYWMFALISILLSLVLYGIARLAKLPAEQAEGVMNLFSLAIILPGMGVSIRRLHDIGKSGWWVLINLIPLIGFIVMIYFYVKDSEPGENKYGPNPKSAG